MTNKRRPNPFERGIELIRRVVEKFTGTGNPSPPEAKEPEIVTPVSEPIEDIDDDYDEWFELENDIEEEETDDENDIVEDDFESYLRELEEFEEDEDRVIEVKTLTEFLDAGGDVKQLRKIRYVTEQEARDFLQSAGLAAFSEIIFDENSDTFALVVGDSPGAKTRK